MYRSVPLLPFVLITGCAALLVLLTAASARRGLPRPLPGDRVVVVRHNPMFRWSVLAVAVVVPIGLTVLQRLRPAGPAGRAVPARAVPGVHRRHGPAGLGGRAVLPARDPGRARGPLGLARRGRSVGTSWTGSGTGAERVLRVPRAGRADGPGVHVRRRAERPAPVGGGARPGGAPDAGAGYARVGRPFPALPDEPVLEARRRGSKSAIPIHQPGPPATLTSPRPRRRGAGRRPAGPRSGRGRTAPRTADDRVPGSGCPAGTGRAGR